jgi:phospholipid/cholesterol/gamma-HCH transport system substrate-binding protein
MRDPEPFNNLVSATAHLDSILAKVDAGDGTAGQIVNDQDLYTDLLNLMTRMNTLVKDLQENPKKYFKFSIF